MRHIVALLLITFFDAAIYRMQPLIWRIRCRSRIASVKLSLGRPTVEIAQECVQTLECGMTRDFSREIVSHALETSARGSEMSRRHAQHRHSVSDRPFDDPIDGIQGAILRKDFSGVEERKRGAAWVTLDVFRFATRRRGSGARPAEPMRR
jgi:hypothetical protein